MQAQWDSLSRLHSRIVLSFTQEIPRKGFPLLISEWQAYRERSHSDLGILVKCSTFNPSIQTDELAAVLLSEIEVITAPSSCPKTGIFLTFDQHTEEDLDSLYRKCFALVSTTLGEGFGGPIVEAALRDCPVIAPRHSAISSYMPQDYPLSMECDRSSLSLKNQLFYPLSARWGVIRPGQLADKLGMLETLGGEDRRSLARILGESVLAYCSEERVRNQFREGCLKLHESTH
jgi:glycosyltransferase involved in cell wall biosynthesis